MVQTPVLIDTDPGTDDAVALLLAAALHMPVRGVLSSYGNLPLKQTHANAAALLRALDIQAPLIRGADAVSPNAEEIHGMNGLGGADFSTFLPERDCSVSTPERLLETYPQWDYIVLGPLTNLARLLHDCPAVCQRIRSVTVMGGGFERYNMPRDTEFNFYCDPQAVQTVLQSDLPLTLIPLDVTHTVTLSLRQIHALPQGCLRQKLFKQVLLYNCAAGIGHGCGGAVLHDAVAVAASRFPERFCFEQTTVCCDKYGHIVRLPGGKKMRVAVQTDSRWMYEMLAKSMAYLEQL